jgi:hypothetical protein
VGELQGENQELRRQIQQQQEQQQQQDEERLRQLNDISRLKSEVLALNTRLQSSEGDGMRQQVLNYEQVHQFSIATQPQPHARFVSFFVLLTSDEERAPRTR